MTFQQGCRPGGIVAEGKNYFSGNHKVCGYKVEVSVISLRLAIGCTGHYLGSIPDVERFRQNSGFYNKTFREYVRALHSDDDRLFEHHKDDFWTAFADKGY